MIGRFLFAVAVLISSGMAVSAADRDEKFSRLALAISADQHCDMNLDFDTALTYYKSFKATLPSDDREALQTIIIFQILGRLLESTAWSDGETTKQACSDLVRWFGPKGTEIPGMLTGSGQPKQ